MLLLTCPHCGVEAEETELTAAGEAHIARAGPGASDGDLETDLFHRQNPKGPHLERWRHSYGCGKWFHAARDTGTMEVYGTYPANVLRPPEEILERMRAARPGFSWGEFT